MRTMDVHQILISIGQDISTRLQTRILMVIQDPTHSQWIIDRHSRKVQLRNTTHARLIEARNKILESLAADAAINNLDYVLKTAYLQNETEEADLAIQKTF